MDQRGGIGSMNRLLDEWKGDAGSDELYSALSALAAKKKDAASESQPNRKVKIKETIPEGYTTVTPWLISQDTDRELAFIRDAFGGEELARVPNEDGGIGHAEARIGDAIVMLFDAPTGWPPTPCFLRLYVADIDETYARALTSGASSVTAPTEMFWGDRVARIRDPLGNVWWIQQRVAELTPEEIETRAAQPEFAEGMAYVQRSLAWLQLRD